MKVNIRGLIKRQSSKSLCSTWVIHDTFQIPSTSSSTFWTSWLFSLPSRRTFEAFYFNPKVLEVQFSDLLLSQTTKHVIQGQTKILGDVLIDNFFSTNLACVFSLYLMASIGFLVAIKATNISNVAPNRQEEHWSDDKDEEKEDEQEKASLWGKKRKNPPKKGTLKASSKSWKINTTLPVKALSTLVYHLFMLSLIFFQILFNNFNFTFYSTNKPSTSPSLNLSEQIQLAIASKLSVFSFVDSHNFTSLNYTSLNFHFLTANSTRRTCQYLRNWR